MNTDIPINGQADIRHYINEYKNFIKFLHGVREDRLINIIEIIAKIAEDDKVLSEKLLCQLALKTKCSKSKRVAPTTLISLLQQLLTTEKTESYTRIVECDLLLSKLRNITSRTYPLTNVETSIINTLESLLKKHIVYDEFYGKKIISIVGATESGKSKFVNEYILQKNILPINKFSGESCVPTYIVSSNTKHNEFYAINQYYNKTKLTSSQFKLIISTIKKDFLLDLEMLLNSLIVSTPTFIYKNLLILDLPGYDKHKLKHDVITHTISESEGVIFIKKNGVLDESENQCLQRVRKENRDISLLFIINDINENIDEIKVHLEKQIAKHNIHEFDILASEANLTTKVNQFLSKLDSPSKNSYITDCINQIKAHTDAYIDKKIENINTKLKDNKQLTYDKKNIPLLEYLEQDEQNSIDELNHLENLKNNLQGEVDSIYKSVTSLIVPTSERYRLRILKAKYGCGKKLINVKKLIEEQIKNNTLSLNVNDETMQHDTKQCNTHLFIEYKSSGIIKDIIAYENDKILISAMKIVYFVNSKGKYLFVDKTDNSLNNKPFSDQEPLIASRHLFIKEERQNGKVKEYAFKSLFNSCYIAPTFESKRLYVCSSKPFFFQEKTIQDLKYYFFINENDPQKKELYINFDTCERTSNIKHCEFKLEVQYNQSCLYFLDHKGNYLYVDDNESQLNSTNFAKDIKPFNENRHLFIKEVNPKNSGEYAFKSYRFKTYLIPGIGSDQNFYGNGESPYYYREEIVGNHFRRLYYYCNNQKKIYIDFVDHVKRDIPKDHEVAIYLR